MGAYEPASDELVVLHGERWILDDAGREKQLSEIVLTNRNLVLVNEVQQGLFRKVPMVMKCPLDRVLDEQGAPAVMTTKLKGVWWVQAVFGNEVLRLRNANNNRLEAERLATAIKNVALGDLSGVPSESVMPPELAGVVGGAKDLLGSIVGAGASMVREGAGKQANKPAMVSTVCPSCHAPLSGRKGTRVTCPYCDSPYTL